ncbi:MAG: styrene monooxygenase/indole monooxygenase family protein [Nannocystaceae bacterium]
MNLEIDVYARSPAGADRAISSGVWHLSPSMSRITIVGAGQAGLQLGLSLLRHGCDVTLVTDRRAGEVASGRVMSTQCLFPTSLDIEREQGLDDFADDCPAIESLAVQIGGDPTDTRPLVQWEARFDRPASSTDQRLKFPRWMEKFVARGGKLLFDKVDVAGLEALRDNCDLLIVAAGKGEISGLFPRDKTRSPYDTPQRALALVCATGLRARATTAVSFNIAPGVGEFVVVPCLTAAGPSYNLLIEGVVGGPFDVFGGVRSPEEHLARTLDLLSMYFPWEAERCQNIALTDANAYLSGRFPPTVRKPIAKLPSGRRIMGLGDVFALNDPLTGQGANNACKSADVYYREIVGHIGSFDDDWMTRTAERAFSTVLKPAIHWTNLMLHPPPHVVEYLIASGRNPALGRAFARGFDTRGSQMPTLAGCGFKVLAEVCPGQRQPRCPSHCRHTRAAPIISVSA